MNENKDGRSIEERSAGFADCIRLNLNQSGRKRDVAELLRMIDEATDEDESGMPFSLEIEHAVPNLGGITIRLRIIPSLDAVQGGSGQTEFGIKVTTGDLISSLEEESELVRIADKLQRELRVKCTPVFKKRSL